MRVDPDLPAFAVAGLPDVQVLDLTDPGIDARRRDVLLEELAAIHLEVFADYPHVVDEWRLWRETGQWPVPGVTGHLFLVLHHDEPVGQMLIDTHLRRGVTLVHFIAVRGQTRAVMPVHALRAWIRFFYEVGRADCEAAGVPLIAVAGEVPVGMVRLYNEYGFDRVGIDYGEPEHGMGWREHGPPQFRQQALIMFRPPGSHIGAAQAAREVVETFALDHYRLPRDHPRVAAMLAGADHQRATPAAVAAAAQFTVDGDPWSF